MGLSEHVQIWFTDLPLKTMMSSLAGPCHGPGGYCGAKVSYLKCLSREHKRQELAGAPVESRLRDFTHRASGSTLNNIISDSQRPGDFTVWMSLLGNSVTMEHKQL